MDVHLHQPGIGQRPHLVPNVAEITGQPSDADGNPLQGVDLVADAAIAVVRVLTPGIEVVKTALRDPVLDHRPGDRRSRLPTRARRSTPTTSSNTGTVPLALTPGSPTNNTCSPLVPATPLGDDNGNGTARPDEVWTTPARPPSPRRTRTRRATWSTQ